MPDLRELIERIERAEASEQRDYLVMALYALYPAPELDTKERAEWCNLTNHFHDLIAVRAYESAAMMLVPPGWAPMFFADLAPTDESGIEADGVMANAATLALALAAAALKAHAEKEKG
jgi:hypothetical protein